MEESFEDFVSQTLEEIRKTLKNIEDKNEIPYTTSNMDTVCQKLDRIIELLENK